MTCAHCMYLEGGGEKMGRGEGEGLSRMNTCVHAHDVKTGTASTNNGSVRQGQNQNAFFSRKKGTLAHQCLRASAEMRTKVLFIIAIC